jgi:hypothetical protein
MTNANQPRRSPNRSGVSRLLALLWRRNIVSDVVQGIIAGGVLAFITFQVIAHAYVTKVNGWTTIYGCGEPGNGILLRGVCGAIFPGPINAPQEAMYWNTNKDDAGQELTGGHDYMMRFPVGQLPPTNAFWSLTMNNLQNQFVPNLINRYSVSDRSGLVPDADGSVEIYIQHTAPAGHGANWLPAPAGNFILRLRVYLPGKGILDGQYKVPPVVETQ